MLAFALVLLESGKCFNHGSGSQNGNKEMTTKDILKEKEIQLVPCHG